MFAGGELRAIAVAVAVSTLGVQAQEMPTMPMGMNLGFNVRWSKECTFIDAMKSSSDWITYHSGGGWNTKVADSLEVDENGYPLEIPQTIDGNETRVRFLVNNYYEGRYVFLYDGEGEFPWPSMRAVHICTTTTNTTGMIRSPRSTAIRWSTTCTVPLSPTGTTQPM